MKRMRTSQTFTGLGLLVLVLVVIFLAGPQIEINTTLHPVTLPTDIEAYVANSEAAFDDIIAFTDADDPAQHVLAGDILSPSSTKVIARMILDFVRKYDES